MSYQLVDTFNLYSDKSIQIYILVDIINYGDVMPHKCTKCEQVFDDGAAAILNGCPNCGWNKFLYVQKETPKEVLDKSDIDSQEGDDTSKSSTPAEEFIDEIDQILGVDVKKKYVSSEDDDKVESVKILGPGSYELNLDSLLTRKEIVMAIKEDGSYALHLPSVFQEKGKKKKK